MRKDFARSAFEGRRDFVIKRGETRFVSLHVDGKLLSSNCDKYVAVFLERDFFDTRVFYRARLSHRSSLGNFAKIATLLRFAPRLPTIVAQTEGERERKKKEQSSWKDAGRREILSGAIDNRYDRGEKAWKEGEREKDDRSFLE